MVEGPVEAWRVHDTGLVAVPSPFRRLGGLVRHLQGHGTPWPDAVTLLVDDDGLLRVTGSDGLLVGTWSADAVEVTVATEGPPVSFVLGLPDATHLLAAASGPGTRALLDALGPPTAGAEPPAPS